ncbi:MAG: ankyrin repeat domain-containing protein [Planctomycetota bacterium]|nr:ankyrin repeat domain-containing protein [Planctomycetota bacterium]MDP7250310.1 ankyrin repeat domain-containing protein [Planctomycetota bacterium]
MLIEQFCKVCLMEMQAETEAEHQRELLQEKTAMEQQARAEDAVSAFRERLLDLRLEYVDDPDKTAKKAGVILTTGNFTSLLNQGGEARDTLLVEISQDAWLVEAFVKSQPEDSHHVRWFLCLACLSPGPVTVERLLAAGANPNFNSEDYQGDPCPLWLTCERVEDFTGIEDQATEEELALSDGYFEVVQLLVKHGADVNLPLVSDVQDYYVAGCTPLHEAAISDGERLAAFLVEKGADRNAQDSHGRTPFDIASIEWEGSDILNILAPD